MAVDYDAITLANTIGGTIQTTGNMNQTVFDSENTTGLNIVGINSIQLTTSIFAKKNIYPSDSFILDHIVYGYLDSATFKLDGGYLSVGTLMYSATG
jgi:hypothetical protein